MKEKFERAKIRIIKFETEDIITTSGGAHTGDPITTPEDNWGFDE